METPRKALRWLSGTCGSMHHFTSRFTNSPTHLFTKCPSSNGMLAGLQCRSLVLGADRELGGEEAVRLRHRRLGAIEHVVHELTSVRRLHALAVDVIRALLIDEEEVVAAGTSGDVHVLP